MSAREHPPAKTYLGFPCLGGLRSSRSTASVGSAVKNPLHRSTRPAAPASAKCDKPAASRSWEARGDKGQVLHRTFVATRGKRSVTKFTVNPSAQTERTLGLLQRTLNRGTPRAHLLSESRSLLCRSRNPL